MPTTDLSLENIERAAHVIDPVFRDSPQFVDEQLWQALGRPVVVKVETANPIRCFKGRGSDFLVHDLEARQKLVCASAGNFGQAIAYSARTRGMVAEVFVAADANPSRSTEFARSAQLSLSVDQISTPPRTKPEPMRINTQIVYLLRTGTSLQSPRGRVPSLLNF